MPRIHTIVTDTTVQDVDILVGSDGDSTKGNVTRNYTVGSLKTHMINSGVDASFGNLTLSGNATISGNLSVTGNAVIDGNLTFGNADTDTVAFGADIVSNIVPDVNNTYSLGTSSKKWKFIHLSGLQTSGIDFADNVLLRFGADQDFAISHDGQDTNLSNATGIMKFSGLSQFANNVLLPTGIHLFFGGTHSDADLKIFHDGTHSYIQESGDGDLRIETTGSVVVKAPSGVASDLELWADNGSNHSDAWKLTAQTDNVFEIQTKDGGSFAPVIELSASDKKVFFKGDIYAPSNLEIDNITVKAADNQPAQIEFKADKGDNNSDHWRLSAETDNIFEIQTRDGGTYAPSVMFVASNKSSLFKGDIHVSGVIENQHFKIPNAIGSAGQVLKVPSSGNTLEWGSASGSSLVVKTTGTDFTDSLFIGHNTTGTLNAANKNLAVGYDALKDLTTGDSNVAVGYAAGQNNAAGENNVFVGSQSGETVTKSSGSVYVGQLAGRLINDSGAGGNVAANNTFVGYRSGYGVNGQTTHLAINNTVVGAEALEGMTTANKNVIMGAKAGEAITTGYSNTILGFEAGKTLETGSENIIIGSGCMDDIATGKSGVIAIGRDIGNIYVQNNETRIGHTSTVKAEILALHKNAVSANGGGSKTIDQKDSGSIYHLNSTVDGIFTLPNTVGVGAGMQIDFVLTALPATTEHKIKCNSVGANKLVGALTIIDTDTGDATTHVAAQESDNYIAIKLNGSTTGIVGSKIRLTSISSQKWLVEGTILVTGSPGNPFSTS